MALLGLSLLHNGSAYGQEVQFSGKANIYPRNGQPFPASSINTKIVILDRKDADPIFEFYPDQLGCWRGNISGQQAVFVDALWVGAQPPAYLTVGPVQLSGARFSGECLSANSEIRLYQAERLSDELRAKAENQIRSLLSTAPFQQCGAGSIVEILSCWALPANRQQLEGARPKIDQITATLDWADRLFSFDRAKFNYANFSVAIGDVCKAQNLFSGIKSSYLFKTPFVGVVEVYKVETALHCLFQKTADVELESDRFRAQTSAILMQESMWTLLDDFRTSRARILHAWLRSFRVGGPNSASEALDIAHGILRNPATKASWDEFYSSAIRHLGQVVGPKTSNVSQVAQQVHLFSYYLNK